MVKVEDKPLACKDIACNYPISCVDSGAGIPTPLPPSAGVAFATGSGRSFWPRGCGGTGCGNCSSIACLLCRPVRTTCKKLIPTWAQKMARKIPMTRVCGMYVSDGSSERDCVCSCGCWPFSRTMGDPPKDTDIEKENGVSDVSTLGVIEDKSDDSGFNAKGMMQRTRRGTASHKTALSDERADLMDGVRCLISPNLKGENIPISSF